MRRKVLAAYWVAWMRCILGSCWIFDCVVPDMSIIIDMKISNSKDEAIRRGHSRYIGNGCEICGSPVRYTSNSNCINCTRNRGRKKAGTLNTNIDPLKTKQRIDAKLEELALTRELDCLS